MAGADARTARRLPRNPGGFPRYAAQAATVTSQGETMSPLRRRRTWRVAPRGLPMGRAGDVFVGDVAVGDRQVFRLNGALRRLREHRPMHGSFSGWAMRA